MCFSTTEQVIARIVAFAEKQGWPKSRLASEAGLQDTTLRLFGKPDWNPTLRVVRTIERIIPRDFCPPPPASDKGRARKRRKGA